MIEYSDDVRLLTHLPPDQQLAVTGDDLFELLVRVLVAEAKLLIWYLVFTPASTTHRSWKSTSASAPGRWVCGTKPASNA